MVHRKTLLDTNDNDENVRNYYIAIQIMDDDYLTVQSTERWAMGFSSGINDVLSVSQIFSPIFNHWTAQHCYSNQSQHCFRHARSSQSQHLCSKLEVVLELDRSKLEGPKAGPESDGVSLLGPKSLPLLLLPFIIREYLQSTSESSSILNIESSRSIVVVYCTVRK